ncbi:hypothetical protein [Niveibacterium terrae]|uniref:hypothetical protein n=1 Tax=Niveibacterium terrae TaxID=3373598 RepID=UPI003A904D06
MVSDPHPITKIWVINALGSLPMLQRDIAAYWRGLYWDAMNTRMPDVLAKNGVEVPKRLSASRSPGSIQEMQKIWNAYPESQAGVSHVLVLVPQQLIRTQTVDVQFEAALWEPATGRMVWQGHP